ncbi:MAG: type II toxin-antitoxin system HicA family toxin [Candidatus Methanoperedens sp.]|nr:type II toxin-antitoxin system HicA family toxin [Candidatus Methanoperedens sp.]
MIKRLLKAGFDYAPIKGKGSHIALVRTGSHGEKYLVIIPKRDPIPKGTLMSIIKQSGFTREEFIRLME